MVPPSYRTSALSGPSVGQKGATLFRPPRPDLAADPRLVVVPPGAMCNYKVRLSSASEVDAKVKGWLKRAYQSAG